MARQPVQLPSRGGANAAGVGNRAQYLRPAKDTQNSRALASAFSQMNRAFGRIAANEQRIANQQMADELQQAEEEQKLLEERAKFAGLMDAGLGSSEQAALYEANPAAQYSYREGRAEGIVNQFLIDVQTEFMQQDFFGDPAQSDIAREWFQNSVAGAMQGHDTAMIANKMPDIMRTQSSLLTAHANQALITAKDNTESDLSVKYQLALESGDLAALEASEYEGRNNAYQNFGRDGNRISTEALIRGLKQSSTKDTASWEFARNAYINLTRNPEYQKLLSTDLNDQLAQGLLDADRLHGLLATNRNEALERERNVKTEEILQGVETRRNLQDSNYTAEKEALIAIGYSAAEANKLVDDHLAALNTMYDGLIVQPTAAQRAQIANVEAELKHEINRDGLIGAAKRDLLADNAYRLDDAAFERLLKFTPDSDTPVFGSKFTNDVKSSISGLVDNISASMLNDGKFMKAMGFTGRAEDPFTVDMRRTEMRNKVEALLDEELREAASEWPLEPEAQRKFVQDAMYRTINKLDLAAEGRLIEMFYKDGSPGVIQDRFLNDATFRRWFEDTGYLDDHKAAKERNQQALDDYSKAAASRVTSQPTPAPAPAVEMPSSVQTLEVPTSTPTADVEVEEQPSNPMTMRAGGNRQRTAVRRDTSVSEQQDTVTLDMLNAPSELVTLDLPAALATLDVPSASSPTEVPTSSGYQPAMRPNVSREEQQIPEILGSDSIAYRPPIVLPESRDTLDVPETSSPTAIPTSSGAQRATAPDVTREEQQIPEMAQVASRASINAAGTRSTISVPTVDPAEIPTTSGYTAAPRGSALSVAASIPELQQVTSVAQKMISNTSAANPEEILKTTTAFDFAKEYLGKTESDDHKVLTSFIKQVNPQFDNVKDMAWCAGFVNAVLNGVDQKGTGKLNARSFLNWGKSVSEPQEGDVVVFWRESKSSWKGHVGFFAGFDDDGDILVLGGNQNNSVSIKSYDKDRLLGYRRSQ